MNIKLENIELCVYDDDNQVHEQLIKELQDNSKSIYINDTERRIKDFKYKKNFPFDVGFFVQINNELVGYMYISKNNLDEVFLESSLFNKYKGRKYGKLILEEVSNYLINEYNLKSLVLDIDPSNMPAIKTALSVGYEIDEEEYMKRGMTGKILYRLDNYNYINKRRK